METGLTKTVVVIPSLEPDDRLLPYVKGLTEQGYTVVVVDDGSSEAYQPIFNDIAALDGITVLHHEINRGKGHALKTAYRYLTDNMPEVKRIITADADGQHTLMDVDKVDKALTDGATGVVLGSRDFSLGHVPKKSRFGNRMTSFVFWLLFGVWCPDTQTGLRGFSASLLPFMLGVSGERFEYEMQVLIEATREKIPLEAVSIETVYENKNEGTHFHPIRDSYRIYKVILGNFVKFAFTSLFTTCIDLGIYYVLLDVLPKAFTLSDNVCIMLSEGLARIVSASLNFAINKKLVFNLKTGGKRAFLRYVLTCLLVITLSIGIVTILKQYLHINERISKPIVDVLLFFLSYRLQRNWVYKEEKA